MIFAAADAARQARIEKPRTGSGDALALIVSCAGRHQTMGQRTEEELEVVAAELGAQTTSIGFYSYGEISPMTHSGLSEVHNQTITITVLTEVEA